MRAFCLGASITALALVGLAACHRANVQCGIDPDCNLKGGGVCTFAQTGNQWCAYPDPSCLGGYRYADQDVGDGVSGSCVEQKPQDAGVDADPARPIVDNGQLADAVLGQESFTTSDVNHGGVSASSFNTPSDVAVGTNGAIWVLDSGNNRALEWLTAPTLSFAPASLVLGSSSLSAPGPATSTAATFTQPTGIAAGGGKLLIAEGAAHRVLIWNPAPTTAGQPANLVLGQVDFTSQKLGAGAADFKSPHGIWTDGTRLAISDVGNNRVLIWNTFPTFNNQPADLVIGQPDFGLSGQAGPSSTSMHFPAGVYFDGVRLYVADGPNARVLVWNSFPTMNGQPASYVIGQTSLDQNNVGYFSNQLSYASAVTVAGNAVFVADYNNARVLVYSPIPTASDADATQVLGIDNVNARGEGRTTQFTFTSPAALAVQGHALYIADGFNRVLRFRLNF